MHEPARVDFGMLASDFLHVARENRDARELLDNRQPRAQAIVDIVIVVRDFVGEIASCVRATAAGA